MTNWLEQSVDSLTNIEDNWVSKKIKVTSRNLKLLEEEKNGCTTSYGVRIGMWAVVDMEKVEVGKIWFVLIAESDFVQEHYVWLVFIEK